MVTNSRNLLKRNKQRRHPGLQEERNEVLPLDTQLQPHSSESKCDRLVRAACPSLSMLGRGGQGPVIAAPPEALGAGEHLQTHHITSLTPIGTRAWKPPGAQAVALLTPSHSTHLCTSCLSGQLPPRESLGFPIHRNLS